MPRAGDRAALRSLCHGVAECRSAPPGARGDRGAVGVWGGGCSPSGGVRGAGEMHGDGGGGPPGAGTEMKRKREAQSLSGTIVFMADDRFTDTGAVRGKTEPPKHAAPPQRYEIIYRNNGGAENPLPCPAENGAPPGTLAQHPVCPDPERQGGTGAQPTAGTEPRYRGRNAPRGCTAPGGSAAPGQPRSPALPPGGFRGARPLRAADNTTTTHSHTQTTASAAGPPAGHVAPPWDRPRSPGRAGCSAAHSRTRLGLRSCW